MWYASKLAVVVAGLLIGMNASPTKADGSWGVQYVGHGWGAPSGHYGHYQGHHSGHYHGGPHYNPHYSYYRSYYAAPAVPYWYGHGGHAGCYAPRNVYVAPPNHGGFGIQGRNASFWLNF